MAGDRVILDLDGTLLDTRARHHASYVDALRGIGGEPLALAPFWRAKRRGVGWGRLLQGSGAASSPPAGFFDAWNAVIESDRMLALDRLQPGAARALRRLAGRGLGAVLVTARRDRRALDRQLQILGLGGAFDAVVNTGGAPKHESVRGHGAVMRWIGDTEEDIFSARALGVPVTAVANGIRAPSLLAKHRPDDLASSVGAAIRRLG